MSVGRNFAEILRALDAVQATDGVPFATPPTGCRAKM
jgi:alkyl hydroperoxide reductase subunit AhpC